MEDSIRDAITSNAKKAELASGQQSVEYASAVLNLANALIALVDCNNRN